MKIFATIGAFVVSMAFIFACSCDNIYSPMKTSLADINRAKTGEERQKKVLTDRDLVEIYNFVSHMNEFMHQEVDAILELRKTDKLKASERQAKYDFKDSSRRTVLKVRLEWLKDNFKGYPPDHPNPMLQKAIKLLLTEIKNLDRKLLTGREPLPGLDKRLNEHLERTAESIEKLGLGVDEPIPIK